MKITAISTIVHDNGVAAPGEVFDIDGAEGVRLCGLGAASEYVAANEVSTEGLGPSASRDGDPVEGKPRRQRAKKDKPVTDAAQEPEAGEEDEE